MDKTYSRINWQNEPSINTPINEVNLNKMDYSLDAIDDRVIVLDTTKANQSDLLLCIKSITYDTTSGIFTFTWQNGNTLKVDLNIEKIPVSFSMSESGVITMKNTDGSTYTADVGELIKTYSFIDSSTVNFTITIDADGNKKITADIVDGSITDNKLQANYLADITTQANNASVSATASANSANLSANNAIEAESWAVGGTGTREGEDTNNAKYWSEQAKGASYQQSDWNVEDDTASAFINNKPFKTIGEHLSVDENGALNAEGGGDASQVTYNETTVENALDSLSSTIANNRADGYLGKNLLKPTLQTTTKDGVTCTNNGDGTYTLNGTASATAFFEIVSISNFSKLGLEVGKTYKLVGCPSGGSANGYQIKGRNTGGVYDIGNGWNFNYDSSITDYMVVIRVGSGTVCDNVVFKPMITTDTSATYDDYVQYSKSNVELTNEKANNGSSAYDPSTSYSAGEHCIYGGKLWCCNITCSGQTPIEGTYWREINLCTLNNNLLTFIKRADVSGTTDGTGNVGIGPNNTWNNRIIVYVRPLADDVSINCQYTIIDATAHWAHIVNFNGEIQISKEVQLIVYYIQL